MPFIRYFGFVGSGLVALLFGLNWLVPEPRLEPARADVTRPAIRISSIEKLPERIVFDTSAPPALPRIVKTTQQSAFVFAQITPGTLATFEPKRRSSQAAPKISFNYSTDRFQPVI